MHTYKIKKLPKNTVEIEINIPNDLIKKEKHEALVRLQKNLVVEGFRKGKVPLSIAEKHLSADTIYQEMLKVLLSKIYEEVVKKESLKPIANPKVDLLKAKEGEDWLIKITLAEKPEVNLGEYKKKVKDLKANTKKADIWVPGKDKEVKKDEDNSKLLNQILEAVLNEAKVEIPDLIIEDELNYRLSRLVDDIQKLGMTTDAYLKSKNLTMEQLKENFRKEIEDTYKLEFILTEIADKENIKVEKADLDKLFDNIKDEKERQQAYENSYFYASIIRKQKTIDFLLNL
ncbi:MAG: trigger factor [Microgenomates group bacterium]